MNRIPDEENEMTYQPPPGEQPQQPYGSPPPPPPPPGGQQWSPPPSGGQYGPPPGQPQYGAPPPQQYGPPAQPQYGAPPPQQYGPPAQQYGAPPQQPYGQPSAGPSFDPKSVNPLDWAIVGCAVLGLIFTYFHYYTYHGYTQSGGFFGFLAWVLGIIGAAAILLPLFVPTLSLPLPPRLIGLGAFGLATLITLLKLLLRPSYGGCVLGYCNKITVSVGFGWIVCLIAFAAGTVLSLMRLQATGGQLPGGLNKLPKIG